MQNHLYDTHFFLVTVKKFVIELKVGRVDRPHVFISINFYFSSSFSSFLLYISGTHFNYEITCSKWTLIKCFHVNERIYRNFAVIHPSRIICKLKWKWTLDRNCLYRITRFMLFIFSFKLTLRLGFNEKLPSLTT